MRIDPGRRRLLAGLGAGLLAGPASASTASGPAVLAVRQRWTTGNATLNPPSLAGELIVFSGDLTIGAVRPGAGEALWVRPHGFDTPAAFRPRTSGAVMVTGGRHWLAAFEIATGKEIWRHAAHIQTGVPLVAGGRVFFGDGHEILALDLESGRELWRFAGVPDTLASYAPAMAGDTVLAGPGDGRLYALSAATGGLLWEIDGRTDWQYLRQLHVDGTILVAGSYKEKLFGLDTSSGRRLWSFNAGNFINSHHVTAGSAYLWSPTGWVYAIDTTTGAMRWRHRTTDYGNNHANWASLMAELVAHDGQLLALAMDDILHLLDLATGEETASYRVPARVRHAVLPAGAQSYAFPVMGGDLLLAAPA